MVKVDDTTSGIVAGINAGCWTVGIAKTVIRALGIKKMSAKFCGNFKTILESAYQCFARETYHH